MFDTSTGFVHNYSRQQGNTEMETTITTRAGQKITGIFLPYTAETDAVQITKGKWTGRHILIKKTDRE